MDLCSGCLSCSSMLHCCAESDRAVDNSMIISHFEVFSILNSYCGVFVEAVCVAVQEGGFIFVRKVCSIIHEVC